MTIDTKNLRTLAEAATPGPWSDKGVTRSCTLKHTHGKGECIYNNVIFYEDDHGITQAVAPFAEVAGNYDYEEGGIIKKADQLYIAACSPDVVLALLDALERKDRLLNAACNALQLQPRQTREVWKDGIDIDIAVAHTKARDAAIEAITKELT